MKKHHVIILLWFVISIYGAAIAFSATYVNVTISAGNPFSSLIAQLIVIIFLGLAGIFIFVRPKSVFTYRLMKRLSKSFMIAAIVSLLVVLLIGPAAIRGGAKMVIPVGPIDFQPLEMFKIALLLYFATEFSSVKPNDTLRELVMKLLVPGAGLILLAIQPDFGGAAICAIVIFFMLFINGQNIKQLIQITGAGIVGIIVMFPFLQDYQRARIFMWLDPFTDAKGSGYQLINSYVAISNGGIFGSGYMTGVQKAGYLTQPGSDFIFATICEELGFLGASFTVFILFAIAVVAISIGNTAHERFGMLYCYGFAVLILTQTFINIGGVSGVIPMTGVTLPFISTGINSYAFLTLGLFLTIPISKMSYKERKRERKSTDSKSEYKQSIK